MILASPSHLFTCFCIRAEGGIGTAFAFRRNHRTLFLTARHVLGGATVGGFIYFKRSDGWVRFELVAVTAHPDGYDVSAFEVVDLSVEVNHEFSHQDDPPVHPGAELKFTGFPHGLENTASSPSGFSTPLVRTAFFSGMISEADTGRSLLILDGLNNPGYSGGPVWAAGADPSRPHLLGLISGYRIEERGKSRVYEEVEGGLERPAGSLFVKPNSGMIHAVAYADLIQLLKLLDDSDEGD